MYIDINIIDALDDCSGWEIDQVIEWLKDNDYIANKDVQVIEDKNLMDHEWDKVIDKLSTKRIYLTQQEEDTIKSIANRL